MIYKKGKTILPDWATWECYRTDVTGVGCYSSKDLLNWKFEGIVLPAVKDDPNHDLHPSKVLERPKVVYKRTDQQENRKLPLRHKPYCNQHFPHGPTLQICPFSYYKPLCLTGLRGSVIVRM